MSIIDTAKPTSKDPFEKRTSITNSMILDHHDCIDRHSQKSVDRLKRTVKRANLVMKDYKFQTFDLADLQKNITLANSNHKFGRLLTTLQLYNKKLINKAEYDIVNYKLHEFYYSTLRICNTKTESQCEFYLREVDAWLNSYGHKRELVIEKNNTKQSKKGEQDMIRQTFNSTLPLEIDQYNRKICMLNKQSKSKKDRINKMNSLSNKLSCSESQSQQDTKFMAGITHHQKNYGENKENKKDKQFQLPNLRSYQTELLKMRQVIEEREQKQLINRIKKNKARIQTQTVNNFYKPFKNRNDIFNKTTVNINDEETSKRLLGEDSSNNSHRDRFNQTAEEKQNHRIIINSTSMGFYQIKKKNLNNQLGVRRNFGASTTGFPKFFVNTDGYFNPNSLKRPDSDQWQTNEENSCEIANISGINLIRNPFEIVKNKKQKKSK